jgi:hypothetical protein
MAITTLSMVLTVFILNLHHVADRPVPLWAKKVVLIYLARALGICSLSLEEIKRGHQSRNAGSDQGHSTSSKNHVVRRASVRFENEGTERTTILEIHPTHLSSDYNERQGLTLKNKQFRDNYSSMASTPTTVLSSIPPSVDKASPIAKTKLSSLDVSTSFFAAASVDKNCTPSTSQCKDGETNNHKNDKSHPKISPSTTSPVHSHQPHKKGSMDGTTNAPDFSKEWQKVAEVFDRLFFWLFLLAILISTLVLFHPLTDAYIKQSDSKSAK